MKSSFALSAALFASAALAQQALYGQCGGQGWTGPTTCVAGSTCQFQNPWYSQCLPGSASPPPATTFHTSTIAKTSTTQPASPATSTPAPPSNPPSSGGVKYAGVNIAGFDFGCGTDGTCTVSGAYPPLKEYFGADGAGQMSHFAKDDGMNAFRLPVGWQYLVNGVLGGNLDTGNFAKYDALVKACLATGALCIIDIHNYARWNGAIIGQGGPTNDQFASLWSQIANKYASNPKVAFGLMNEPHDIPDIKIWAGSAQAAVTAIRKAGATSQLILLPGNGYTSAGSFVSSGSLDALKTVKNIDGSTTNLIFDVHKYLDSDNSGTNAECVSNQISEAFAPLATALKAAGRQAIVTETGGGNTASCAKFVCQEIAFLNSNSDVYIGYTGWAAGNFDTGYVLSETPTNNGGTWTDKPLVSSCLKR